MAVDNLETINTKVLSYGAKLLPVVKNRTIEEIKFLYDFGFREFGENRLEDFKLHKNEYSDVSYHFIAPIQSRKISEITQNFQYIHTVARKKEVNILETIDTNCKYLLQINIDDDPKKSGIQKKEIYSFFEHCIDKGMAPEGIMTIPNIDSDPKIVFSNMQKINDELKIKFGYKGELSMGMSNDYEIALDYGATIVRIGTKLFK